MKLRIALDIDFSFIIMRQGICFYRNMFLIRMFSDSMDTIACIVLR